MRCVTAIGTKRLNRLRTKLFTQVLRRKFPAEFVIRQNCFSRFKIVEISILTVLYSNNIFEQLIILSNHLLQTEAGKKLHSFNVFFV